MGRTIEICSRLLFGLVAGFPAVAAACPSCKDAISGDPVATALSATTLVLIAIPLALFGGMGCWVAYKLWRAQHAEIEPADGAIEASPFYPLMRQEESES